MKNILLATFLTAIFASGALGQDEWMDGVFYYPIDGDSLVHHGVTYFVDSAWKYGQSNMDEFDGYNIVSLNLDGPIQQQGEWQIAVTGKQDYYSGSNCMDADGWDFYYKLYGGNDSAGLIVEMSWDSTTWYNLADNNQVDQFHDAYDFEMTGTLPYLPDSVIITLPDGRKAMGNIESWHNFGYGIDADYTWDGVGSIFELHWRLTFVNYTINPVKFGLWHYFIIVNYWCEYLGIGEHIGNLNVKLYPNPVSECTVIEMPVTTTFPAECIITDPNGRIVYVDQNVYNTTIPFYNMNLLPGIYMFHVKDSENKTCMGKFIVAN